MGTEEKAYWNKDVAEILKIGESTVRKWCLELEQNGYTFIRGYKDSRAFLQHDLDALREFKTLTKEGHFKVDQAAKMVVERYGKRKEEGPGNAITAPVMGEEKVNLKNVEEMLRELVRISNEQLENSKSFNRELLDRLEERDKIIDEQHKILRIEYEKNENRAIEERSSIHEYPKEYKAEDEKKPKKKGLIERINNLFKK